MEEMGAGGWVLVPDFAEAASGGAGSLKLNIQEPWDSCLVTRYPIISNYLQSCILSAYLCYLAEVLSCPEINISIDKGRGGPDLSIE